MNLIEKTDAQQYIYKGRIINLRVDDITLPNGAPATREVVEHNGGVCVLALTDQDEVLLVQQYRYPYQTVLTEIPAGKISPGEDPLECGKRELQEETGAVAAHYQSLGVMYPTPGYCGEIIYIYLATDLSFGDTNPDDDEFLQVRRVPFSELLQQVLDGNVPDAKTQIAVLKLACMRGLS